MKTSTTTHLQLDKLDRVALDRLREALRYYTRLTDIAVNGTPLTNQDAIVLVVCAHSVAGMDWVFSVPVFRFAGCPFIASFFDCCFQFWLQFPLPWQTMDTMFGRGVVSLNPRRNIFPKRRLLSFVFAATAAVVVVLVVWNPRRGPMMQLHCFEVELARYKWKIVDCMMQQQLLQKRCWIRQHGHSSAWICDVMVSQVSELVCFAYLPPQNEQYGFNWPHWSLMLFLRHKKTLYSVGDCSFLFNFIQVHTLRHCWSWPAVGCDAATARFGHWNDPAVARWSRKCRECHERRVLCQGIWMKGTWGSMILSSRKKVKGWRSSISQTSCSKSLHNQSSSEIQIARAYHILGSVTMLHVSSCCFSLCKPCRSKFRHF